MIIRLKKIEYIKHKKTAKIMVFFGLGFIVCRFLIATDKSLISNDCLCEKCNTTYKGHYGVGYYTCKNADKLVVI